MRLPHTTHIGSCSIELWGIQFSSYYLTNHIPSYVVQNQVPGAISFLQSTLLSLSPCVFWSTCLVHNITQEKTNWLLVLLHMFLSIFLRVQKRYQRYSSDLHRYLITRYLITTDVTSFEGQPYYTSSAEHQDISEAF